VRTKIEASLRETSADGGSAPSVRFTGSVGLAVYPGDAVDSEALVKYADRDMYLRKAARNDPPRSG
jgi:GGDEF domain-containing protein